MVNVLGYARKSPDEKEDIKTSIINQVSLIEKTCKEKGWKLLDTYIDKSASGGDRSRTQFNKMIKRAIEDPAINIIVVKEQDRFARDSAFFTDTLRDLEIREKRVFSVIKNKFLSYEDLGDVVTSVVDAHYIITQRKKSNLLFNQKKESGLPPIKAPFGYINKNKKWLPHRKKSEIVKEICKDKISGVNFKETISRLKITSPLYYRVLRNAQKGLYSGYVVYVQKIRDSQKNIIKEQEIKYKGSHEKIIDDKTWDKLK